MGYKCKGYTLNCSSRAVKKKEEKKRKYNGLKGKTKFLSRAGFPCRATVQFFVSFSLPFSDSFFYVETPSLTGRGDVLANFTVAFVDSLK